MSKIPLEIREHFTYLITRLKRRVMVSPSEDSSLNRFT